MIPFRRILFPVDLSEPSRRAVPYVRAMAQRFHSELSALHVMVVPIVMYGPPEGATWAALSNVEAAKRHHERQFEAFVRSEFDGLEVRTEFLDGRCRL